MNKYWMILILSVLVSAGVLAGDLKLDPVFSSNMMLQQEKPIAFFGSADGNAGIQVDFAGKKVSVKADAKGAWRAEFPAMKAGKTTYSLRVASGGKNIELKNILVGDVWVCSGQSNMEMPIAKTFRRGWAAANCEQEVAAADYPEIRYADQRNTVSHNQLRPAAYQGGDGWVVCSPSVADRFSATAYFFARKLHQDLNIPIGLINLTWSGTRMEPWISREGYESAKLDSDLAVIRKFTMTPAEKNAYEKAEKERFIREITEYHKKFEAAGAAAKAAASVYAKQDYDDSSWAKAAPRHHWNSIARWYRSGFTLPENMRAKTLVLSIDRKPGEALDVYLNGTRIGGWAVGIPQEQKVLKVNVKPEQLDQNGKNVLAIRSEYFYNYQDRRSMENLLRRTVLASGKNRMNIGNWREKDEFLFDMKAAGVKLPSFIDIPYNGPQFHSNLYNGMVDAWTKLPVKGVIWYQGCSNAGQAHYYRLHSALIADWRAKWKNSSMPFLIVQLAGFGDSNWQKTPPKDAAYAFTRDIQAQMIRDPNVGLACAVDIGEPANIHPANKQEVGRRLALEAERIAYGKKILSRGPMLDSVQTEGDSIRVRYQYAPNGLKTTDGKDPNGFAIAGADKKFVWARAKIDGNTVVVHSPAVKNPKYVRYAYAAYRGDCNLQNKEGLAAYPFRSDAFDYSKVK